MAYIIACLMAALSFLLNRALLRHTGRVAVISYSPAVEEMAKTLLAYYLGADILATHVAFGVLEGGFDWYNYHRDGHKAAMLSLVGHSLFGALTVAALSFTDSVWLAVLVGLIAHLAWNVTIIRLYAGKGE